MEIFNNQRRSGYEEIASYGPKWWLEYREMDANYRFAGWTLDLMSHGLERLVNNQFPENADEHEVVVYEKTLDIEVDPGESYEERKRIASAYYAGGNKISRSSIKAIIKSYTGCNCDVWWIKNTLNIRVSCDGGYPFSLGKSYKMINRRIPAHIGIKFRNLLCSFELNEKFRNNKVSYRAKMVWWGNALDGKYNLDGTICMGTVFPPFFKYKASFMIENLVNLEFHVLLFKGIIENIISDKFITRYRVHVNWWDNILDGRYNLDGSIQMQARFPSYFKYKPVTLIKNGLKTENTAFMMKSIIQNDFSSKFIPRHRVLLNWWEECNTLDGVELLDGKIMLDQTVPPDWNCTIHRVKVETEEDFKMIMYIPGREALLNGGAFLNGETLLNAGKEEL